MSCVYSAIWQGLGCGREKNDLNIYLESLKYAHRLCKRLDLTKIVCLTFDLIQFGIVCDITEMELNDHAGYHRDLAAEEAAAGTCKS